MLAKRSILRWHSHHLSLGGSVERGKMERIAKWGDYDSPFIQRHREALRRAWEYLRPGGYVVIMDAKLPSGFLGKLLHPFVVWTSRATVLGNPDIRPWEELRELTDDVDCEELQFETYYICRG